MEEDVSLVDRLRRDILDGVYSPGERLIEVELSEKYSQGRASIRAALVQLQSEALVDRKANKGAVVRRISVTEAIEITEARQALESLVAARAARNAAEEHTGALEYILDRMHDAVADDDATRYAELNRRLHEQLLELGGHEVAGDLVKNLRDRGVQNQFRLAMMPGRQKESLQQHADIVEAVVAGDEAAAAAAMARHLESVSEALTRWAELD